MLHRRSPGAFELIGLAELRAGVRVLSRHLRNARGDPRRLVWVIFRTLRILASGTSVGVLQRHVVVDDLYADYREWLGHYGALDDNARAAV